VTERSDVTTTARPAEKSSERLAAKVQSLRMPPPQRSSGGSIVPWLLVMLLAAAATYTALGGLIPYLPRPLAGDAATPEATTLESDATPSPDEPAATQTGPAKKPEAPVAAGSIVLESKGYIIPEQQILVSPQVSGRILELNFDAGQQVQQGFVLAVLDSTEYKAEYEQGNAQVEAAKQRLSEAELGNRPD
jgi:multidrug efflux pump subunit AcrA (membrane-fusion protein)